MTRRSARPTRRHTGATGAVRKQTERPSIAHSSPYLPEPIYEALRKIAFEERLKIHDVVLEGIDLALRRRGYPSIEGLKGGQKAIGRDVPYAVVTHVRVEPDCDQGSDSAVALV